MRVLLTGASGLLGSHTALALSEAGHRIRAFVRDPAKAERVLARLGVGDVELVRGDVTDRLRVHAAIDGCDAAVHAAAIPSLDPRQRGRVMRTNARGAEHVLESACHAGLDPIVHVSSIAALFPPAGDRITCDDQPKHPRDAYAASKAAAERTARALQAKGYPVVIFYPGQLLAPFDPTVGDGVRFLLTYVERGVIPLTPGGMPLVDARDVARAIAVALKPGLGPRRYMAGGHFVDSRELAMMLERICGRHLVRLPMSGPLTRALGRLSDWTQRWLGRSLGGATRESTEILTRGVPTDDSRTAQELGIPWRPARETLADALAWLCEEGALDAALAPALARRSRRA
ncbi:MAG TPA: SDR family NAD(P)-dependent oxidoreductase [Myxococcota bacterium]|nr:SDR family NAD(P)-dependent oxidoreductase [Myxococcota bacterium]